MRRTKLVTPPPDAIATIKLNINLHPAQKIIDASQARFKTVMTGMRFGKTEYGVKYLLDGAGKRPGSKNWFIFPFAKQGRSVVWQRLINLIPKELIKGRPNKTLMDIPLVNGSEIGVRGSDNEESLLGERLGRIVMDEAARQKAHVWEEILRSRLLDYRGEAMFITTPYGKNWFYKLYEYAKSGVDPEWAAFHFTTYDNPYISREELDKLKATTPPRTWKRDYMAEVLEDEGLVYGEFSGSTHVFSHPDKYVGHEHTSKCGRGIDWGYADYCACIWVHLVGKDIVVSAEHAEKGWGPDKHSAVIKDMSLGRRIEDGMTVIDQSAFNTELGLTSVGQLFSTYGINCARATKDKDSGISMVKALLSAKEGQYRIVVSDRCQRVIEALKSWEFGQHEPDVLSALRYIIQHLIKCGLIKLDGIVYNNEGEAKEEIIDPHSILYRNKQRQERYEDLSWDGDSGCPD